MDTVAYSHLYLAYEEPASAIAGNRDELDRKLLLSLLPALIVVSALTSAAPTLATLYSGSNGPAVVELQNRLKDLGYFPKDIPSTGYFGAVTQQAAMKFQAAKQLPADGVVGSQTLAVLGIPETQASPQISVDPLRLGSSGDRVKEVQMQLAALGYYQDKIDGTFNASTKDAVVKFQQESSLETDGIVGPNTSNALQKKVEKI